VNKRHNPSSSSPAIYEVIALLCITLCSCHHQPKPFWKSYNHFKGDTSLIQPKEYADYLKTKFHGQLDSVPMLAIIFYDRNIPEYLDSLGYKPADIKVVAIGETDPEVLYIVKPVGRHIPTFTITGGMPGAGGVCTQAAELGALGATAIIHIGTCGFLDTTIKADEVVLSKGSYNDGAAALLANVNHSAKATALSYPDSVFTSQILSKLTQRHLAVKQLYGVTLPIFYYQPSGLINKILQDDSPTKPSYIEMEGAPFFQTARLGKFRSASIVMGTDYYYLHGQTVKHYFVDFNSKKLKLQVLRALLL